MAEITFDGLNENSLIMQWNTDNYGNPKSIHINNEVQQVSVTHHIIQLAQIPDEYYRARFVAEGINGWLIEVRSLRELKNINNYYVDYNHGIVYFHEEMAGRLVRADYYGRGVMFLSDARIFHKSGDSFATTLDEVLEKSEDAFKLLESTGGLNQAIELLEDKAEEGNKVADRLQSFITETQFYGYTIVLSREAFVVRAKEDGSLHNGEMEDLTVDVVVYKGAKNLSAPDLDVRLYSTTNCECEIENQKLTVTRIDVDCIQAQAIIEIDCGDGLIAYRTIEVTKVFDGVSQFNVEMTNAFHSFSATHSGKIEEEQSVTCEFTVTKANEEFKGYVVGIQNVPSGITHNLKKPTENASSVTFTAQPGTSLPDNASISVVFQFNDYVVTKTFAFTKSKQGLSAKSLRLAGNQIIHYENADYSGTPNPLRTSIVAQVTDLSGTPVWSYLEGEQWIVIDGQSGTSLILYHNNRIWADKHELTIKCELDGFSDEITLIKIANGAMGLSSYSVILSNESTTLRVSTDGTIPTEELTSQYTRVTAFKGAEQITPTSITVPQGDTYEVSVSGSTINLINVDASTSTVNIPIEILLDNAVVVNKVWSIAKTEKGEIGAAGAVYSINVEGGTRAITYNQLNENPRPTFSGVFTAHIYENGNDITSQIKSWYWTAQGHFIGTSINSSFTPEIKDRFDESILNNSVTVTAIYNHMPISYTVPIVVSKDLGGLDWVTDWDSTKVSIRDTEVLTPKLFAGEYNPNSDTINGVAIGTDVLNDGQVQGITGYQNNKVSFLLATDGSLLIGNPFEENGTGLSYNHGRFVLNVDEMAIAGGTVPTWDDMEIQLEHHSKDIINAIQDNIDSMNEALNDMTNYVDTILQDEIITELEKVQLDALFEVVQQELISIQAQYESVINNPYLPDDEVKNLELSYARYLDAHNNILQIYNDIFNEPLVPQINETLPEEEYLESEDFSIETVDEIGTDDILDDEYLESEDFSIETVDEVNEVSLDTLVTKDGYFIVTQDGEAIAMVTKNTLLDFTDAVNVLRSYSSILQQAIAEALLSISEHKAEMLVEQAKEQVRQEIADVDSALSDLETTMNGSFKSGLIGEQSKAILNERLMQLDIEKKDVDGQYEVLSKNSALDTLSKKKLSLAKTDLDVAHDILVAKINQVIIDNLMTDSELQAVNSLIGEYANELQNYSKVAQECNATIAINIANLAVEAITDEDVFNKVTNYGATQGLFIKDEKVYINSEYINTRNFKAVTDDGEETFKIDENGNVHLNVKSFALEGKPITELYDQTLTQEKVFNALTDNGNTQGIFLENGELYVNGEFINSKNFSSVDNNGKQTFLIDENGNVHINANTFTLGGKGVPTSQEVLNMIDEYGQAENYVLTPNFNSGSLSPNWTWSVSSFIYIDTTYKHDENTACRLKGSAGAISLNTKNISISSLSLGTTYKLSMWVYCTATSSVTGEFQLCMYGKSSGSTSNILVDSLSFNGDNLAANQWTRLSFEFTPTQEYSNPSITVKGISGSIDAWVTDFELVQKGESFTQEQLVTILNGAGDGLYLVDGKLLMNAEYIQTGTLAADLIKVRIDENSNLLPVNYITMEHAINDEDFYIQRQDGVPYAECDIPRYFGGENSEVSNTILGYSKVSLKKGKSYWFSCRYFAQWDTDTKPMDGVGTSTAGKSKYGLGTGNNLDIVLYDNATPTGIHKGRNLLDHTNGTDAPHIYSGAYLSSGFQLSNSPAYGNEPGHLMMINIDASPSVENYYRFMAPNGLNLYGLEPGETYTFSGKVCGTMSSITIRHQYAPNDGGVWTNMDGLEIPLKGEDYWQPFEFTFTIPSNAQGYYLSFQDYNNVYGKNCYAAELKLEKSKIATPWCLSPVDQGLSNPTSVERSTPAYILGSVKDFNESIDITDGANEISVYGADGMMYRTWTSLINRFTCKQDYEGYMYICLDGSGFEGGSQGWFYISKLQLTDASLNDEYYDLEYLDQLREKYIELTDNSYYTNIVGVDGIKMENGSVSSTFDYSTNSFNLDENGFRYDTYLGHNHVFAGKSKSWYQYYGGSSGVIEGYDQMFGLGCDMAVGGNREGIFIGIHEGFQVPNQPEYGRADIYAHSKYDGITAWDDWSDWELLGQRIEPLGLVRRNDYCNIEVKSAITFNEINSTLHPAGDRINGSILWHKGLYDLCGNGQLINISTSLDTKGRIYVGNPTNSLQLEGSQVYVRYGLGEISQVISEANLHDSIYIGPQVSETGRTVHRAGVYCFNTWHSDLYQGSGSAYGLGGQYWTTLGWGSGTNGAAELAVNWTDGGNIIAFRSLRDTTDNWWGWKRIYHVGHQQTSTSDVRYKRAIADVDTSDCYSMVKNTALHHYLLLDDTEDLRICSEDGIEELETELDAEGYSRKVQMGIIAQDVLKYECGKYFVVQDIMRDSDGNITSDKYSIDAYNYASAILGGLQEEIKVRDAQYEELKKENEDLKARLDRLEQLILKGE